MAAENAAEVAALRGWKVYFNTLTIAGRRNVGDWGAVSGQWCVCSAPFSTSAAGDCYVGQHIRAHLAERQEEAVQGPQGSNSVGDGSVIGTASSDYTNTYSGTPYCVATCISIFTIVHYFVIIYFRSALEQIKRAH